MNSIDETGITPLGVLSSKVRRSAASAISVKLVRDPIQDMIASWQATVSDVRRSHIAVASFGTSTIVAADAAYDSRIRMRNSRKSRLHTTDGILAR